MMDPRAVAQNARRLFLRRGRFLVGSLPWAWMLLFFVLPFVLIVNISLSTPELATPPYVSPLSVLPGAVRPEFRPDLSSYRRLHDEVQALGAADAELQYLRAYGNSLATIIVAIVSIAVVLANHVMLSAQRKRARSSAMPGGRH